MDTKILPANACRVCMWTISPVLSLFSDVCEKSRTKEKYTEIFAYPVEKDDGRPANICVLCVYKLELFHEFINIGRNAYHTAGLLKDAVPQPVDVNIGRNAYHTAGLLKDAVPQPVDVQRYVLMSPRTTGVDNLPSENVVLRSTNTLDMQNDVPDCSTSENMECGGSIFIVRTDEVDNVHTEYVGPHSNDTLAVQNDVPVCTTSENMECGGSIFIEPENVDSDNSAITFESLNISSFGEHIDSMEDISTEEQNGGNIENNSIVSDYTTTQVNDDNHYTASCPHQNTNNSIGGDVGNTSASLEKQRAAIGSESDPNESAGLPSSTSNNNEHGVFKSVGKKMPQFSCNKCPEKFCSKLQLELHYCNSLSSSDISCRYCHRQFSDRTELSAHKKLHVSLFSESCRKCGEVFQSQKALRVHKNSECIARGGSHQNTPVTPLYKCQLCNRDFSSLSKKKMHKISKKHRANVAKHSLKKKASRNDGVVYKKTGQGINNGTNIVTNSHAFINGNASRQENNDAQTKYPRLRRRTYSDSVWLVG